VKCRFKSRDDSFRLLPALPDDWKNGEINGICLRNGQSADISWSEGKLQKAVIYAKFNCSCSVTYKSKTTSLNLQEGNVYTLDDALNRR
jgi:alpha-L-fucosidase 2